MAYARRLVALNDETVAVFTKPELAGSVRLGTPDDYADIFLPEILARFARSHPMVTVDVECFDSIVLKERVRRGEFDLAIVTFGSGAEDGEVVRREDLLWVTSARLSPHEQKVPVVLTWPGCPWRQAAMAALGGARRGPIALPIPSPNASTMNAAVMQGLAVSAMPRICLRPGMKVLGRPRRLSAHHQLRHRADPPPRQTVACRRGGWPPMSRPVLLPRNSPPPVGEQFWL